MNYLELRVPNQALQCMALLSRMPRNHPVRPIIEKDLRSWMKGYYGEKQVEYYLSLLPEEPYYIFHGLRIKDKKYFQMDLLILTMNFGLIVEIKNISGRICFKKGSNSVTRVYENNEEGISNPIEQVKRHKMQFHNWLSKNQIKGYPIEHLVTFSKTSTLIETTPDNTQIFKYIIYGESLITKIKELEMKYPNPHLSKKKLIHLTDALLQAHQPLMLDILQTYNLSFTELYPGVQCPKCKNFHVNYYSGNWHCSYCNHTSKNAHLPAVDDFLLIHQTITRKQFSEFLRIPSSRIAGNLLRALNLPSTGSKRTTQYYLPPGCILSPLKENDMKKGEIYT
ncbi:NERD domain-containing protein [Paenibacillus sp. BSR1-1]|uniref:nuclease-related domain-containing protein n=1 Tax=Paenibacillus sp. BSR1-1 TaxID=3020845 RepID=UPI0025AFD60E|nr:NERD domain-containing protein [Paenibacillus sp. BSR1-1]MDN3018084.1 NERD domain-containing protein [Paenibacillus sp. BSR1-1]